MQGIIEFPYKKNIFMLKHNTTRRWKFYITLHTVRLCTHIPCTYSPLDMKQDMKQDMGHCLKDILCATCDEAMGDHTHIPSIGNYPW